MMLYSFLLAVYDFTDCRFAFGGGVWCGGGSCGAPGGGENWRWLFTMRFCLIGIVLIFDKPFISHFITVITDLTIR